MRCRGHRALPDEAETTVDRDMGFIAEGWQGDLRKGVPSGRTRFLPPILSVQRASTSFCAALLGSSGQISWAVLPGVIASFSAPCSAAWVRARGRHRRSDPTSGCSPSSAVASRRPSSPAAACRFSQSVAEVPDRVLVGRRSAKIECRQRIQDRRSPRRSDYAAPEGSAP